MFHEQTGGEQALAFFGFLIGAPLAFAMYYVMYKAACSVGRTVRDNTPGPVKEVAVKGAAAMLENVVKGMLK